MDDCEQYFTQEWKPVSESEEYRDCFDCNICLDFANEPVVTLCGHLYCWPCIYNWLHVQKSDSLTDDDPSRCPVCKADIFDTTMVPLYGRGSAPNKDKESKKDMAIPPRPPACGAKALTLPPGQQIRNPYEAQQYGNTHTQTQTNFNVDSPSPAGTHHAFGELIYTRVFGNADNLYTYPNGPRSYYYNNSSTRQRRRRQEIQADKSLNRISVFLFCFFLLCFFVF